MTTTTLQLFKSSSINTNLSCHLFEEFIFDKKLINQGIKTKQPNKSINISANSTK